MAVLPRRFSDLIREKTKFSEEAAQKRVIYLNKLPVGRIDPSSPVGLEYQDSVQIFVDTTPGENGALVFVHEMLQPKWMPSV
ncbi:MAG: hypothetical protein M1421_05940 [Candidatus Eremiobacteraeota bacterium]|nr:hypothetical protein [Candidatus Eremiobacteraeota bacterium]MCL5054393.1 hypothetical protein [Bacillota bacterium]